MKKSNWHAIPTIILVLSQLFRCAAPAPRDPARMFESYTFNEQVSIIDRVTAPPAFALDYLRRLDKRPDYEPYLPSRDEIRLIRETLDSLPPLHKSVLKKRLLAIYFIKNFHGNGLTEWIIDSRKTVYAFMCFNASSLKRNISDLLTEKERTCYIPDDPSIDVRINCGNTLNGFAYILVHEATHAVDYVRRITPYVDPEYKRYMGIRESGNDFTRGVWKGYHDTRAHYLFTGRLSFYGFRKQTLRMSDAPNAYAALSQSPFASLYGALTWAEDLAELVTFYHITRYLNQPYAISVVKNKKPVVTIQPMESPEVRKRLSALEVFYRTGGL